MNAKNKNKKYFSKTLYIRVGLISEACCEKNEIFLVYDLK